MEPVCQPLQYHPNASVTQVVGTTDFPPSMAAAGYGPCFKGFGCVPACPPSLFLRSRERNKHPSAILRPVGFVNAKGSNQ